MRTHDHLWAHNVQYPTQWQERHLPAHEHDPDDTRGHEPCLQTHTDDILSHTHTDRHTHTTHTRTHTHIMDCDKFWLSMG